MRRRLAVAALALLLGTLAVYLAWPRIARALVFMPRARTAHASDAARLYPDAGARTVTIPAGDGLHLHGWWFPARERPCGTVLYLYGNKGDLVSRGGAARVLARQRLNVLLVDYRGYGASPGTPTEAGLYRDARAAYRWIRDAQQVPPGQILLLGHSIGAALATGVAAGEPVAGLVLLSPFSSFPGATRARFPWLPARIADWGGYRFATADSMARVTAPVLAMRGTDDGFTDRSDARRVLAAARGPRTWVDVETAGHNDVLAHRAAWDAIVAFRDRTLPCGAAEG
ncbi:MAG TPA: alpha/beta hydrolase [Longimicrobium sp.]|nr:alpha/beta hydrolase [Longimicrobium sp.]